MASAQELSALLKRFPGQRLLVLGDVILDRYWWGEASRLSPEAPVPVVRRRRSTTRPGGAANTAANLAALGASVDLVGVTGDDLEAGELKAALREFGVNADALLAELGRPTTTKTRIVALHQQIVRVDDEETGAIQDSTVARALEFVARRLPHVAAVVVSDYAKGFLTPALLAEVIAAARAAGKPVLVDPKGTDYRRYTGASLLKPNRLELGILAGLTVRDRDETRIAGIRLATALPGTNILVTEGAEGMTLFRDAQMLAHVDSAPRQVYDVTGAGDTVLAAVAMALGAGADYRQAMQLATEAAAIAISLTGTVAVTLAHLQAAFPASAQ
jgi:D-beta-D-heptose 7-phosphate kinase/D-beta-D-heptose 1-phosphate adenosyltransferase